MAAAIDRVLSSGVLVGGNEVQSFEDEFADYLGADHCIGVGNGSDALEFALRSVGVRPGARVVTVANAGFYATAAILALGARPLFVDIDDRDLQMAQVGLAEAMAAGADAVVLTHLFGDAGRAGEVVAAVRAAGVPVVEDCAQAAGAIVGGQRVGTLGDVAAFSFYPTKNLAAIGDGGAVVTDDADRAEGIRRMAQHGWRERFEVVQAGRNSRLDAIQAAVLRTRLPYLDDDNHRRRRIWARYAKALEGVDPTGSDDLAPRLAGWPLSDGISESHVAHLAVLRTVDSAAQARRILAEAGVATAVHYPIPDHRQPVLRAAGEATGGPHRLPATEAAAEHILSIPCFPQLTLAEEDRVAAVLSSWSDPAGVPGTPGAPNT